MKIRPDVRLVVDEVPISLRQIQALIAIAETHSQNKAARMLGISVPVLHRYIKEIEQRLGVNLISSTPRGTILTESGKDIVDTHKRFVKRLLLKTKPVVACSPLFSHLVLPVVASFERDGYEIDMLIGDDELNRHFLNMGIVDIVVFDDPIFVYREKESYERYEIVELTKDTLIHINQGRKYIRYKYGAQRIGFSNLDVEGIDYEIAGEMRDYEQLIKSGYSYFINRSLARRGGLDIKSETDEKLLMHSIFALRVGGIEDLDLLIHKLSHVQEKL